MSTPLPSARSRVTDRHGYIPVRGAISDFAREHGFSRVTVIAALRAGRLGVAADGSIAPTGEHGAALSQPAPTIDWKERNPTPAHGAFTRARDKFGLGVRPLYLRLQRGEFVVDEQSREIVRASAVGTAVAPPTKPTALNPWPAWYQALDRFAALAHEIIGSRPERMAIDDAIGSLAGSLKRTQGAILLNAARGDRK
jgi:hypothetical protein